MVSAVLLSSPTTNARRERGGKDLLFLLKMTIPPLLLPWVSLRVPCRVYPWTNMVLGFISITCLWEHDIPPCGRRFYYLERDEEVIRSMIPSQPIVLINLKMYPNYDNFCGRAWNFVRIKVHIF